MPKTAPHKAAPRFQTKRERIELRVAPSAKNVIRRAMAVSGMTLGEVAYEGARRLLDEHERMVLVGADRDAFLDAVLNPTPPGKRLAAALGRHRKLFGLNVGGVGVYLLNSKRS